MKSELAARLPGLVSGIVFENLKYIMLVYCENIMKLLLLLFDL